MEQIKIKYHTNIPTLEKIGIGDWIDLRSAEDMVICEGEFRMINLGVSMKLPDGCEAIVAPRSSTFKNFGIIMTNSIGIIDNSYSGTNDIWRFPAYCLQGKTTDSFGRKVTEISKGDRIAQFRIQKRQDDVIFVEVDELDKKNRGGFGTTGVK